MQNTICSQHSYTQYSIIASIVGPLVHVIICAAPQCGSLQTSCSLTIINIIQFTCEQCCKKQTDLVTSQNHVFYQKSSEDLSSFVLV